MKIGDQVKKTSGHQFHGVIVADFVTMGKERRFVVESTVEGARGLLFIFCPDQLADHPYWERYGYPSEAAYYAGEWAGADCPACGKTLAEDGRHHADGSECV